MTIHGLIRNFIEDNGFKFTLSPPSTPGISIESVTSLDIIDKNIPSISHIDSIQIMRIDNCNHYRPYYTHHYISIIINDKLVVDLIANKHELKFIHFIESEYGFNMNYIQPTYRDLVFAINNNEIKWFEQLFKVVTDKFVRDMYKYIVDYVFDTSSLPQDQFIQIKSMIMSEMNKRGLCNDKESIEL